MNLNSRSQAILALIAAAMPAAALTWDDGGPSNNWSITDANWLAGPVVWANGSAADFTAGGGDNLILTSAGMTAGTVTFGAASNYSINTNGNSMTWSALSGSGGFTKSGTGTLTINGAGGASGNILLTSGQLTTGGASALGTTALTVDGSSTVLAANGNNIANVITLQNGGKLTTTNGSTVSSVITLGTGGGQLAGGTSNYGIFTGKVTGGTAGTTSLTINSGHTQLNNTANDFAGNILINSSYYLRTVGSDSIPDTAVITIGGTGGWKLQPAAAGTYTETIAGLSGSGFQIWAEGSGVNATFRIGSGDVSSTFDDTLTEVGGATLAIEKIGSGTFTMNGGSSYSGITTVTGGTLKIGNATALGTTGNGTTVASGAVLDLNGQAVGAEALSLSGSGITSSGALVNTSATAASNSGAITVAAGTSIGGSGNLTLSGAITGSNGLTKVGSGILTLSSANGTTFSGTINVNVGTLKLGNGDALGSDNTGSGKIVVASGATFDVNAASDPRYGITISGSGVGGNGAYINTGAATSLGAIQIPNIKLAANASIGGTGDFAMIAPGHVANSLDLAGNTLAKVGGNTFYLSTTTVSSGTIDIQAGAIGVSAQGGTGASDGGAAAFVVRNGGSLTLARSFNVGSLGDGGTAGGTVSLGANTLTVGALNTNTSFAGGISGTGGGLSKTGSGILTLAGTGTYTGATNVNAGTLRMNGNNSGASGAVTVASGATLGGVGTIGGATTIQAGGIHAPGNSPGLQSFTNLTYADAAIFSWEIDRTLTQTRGTGYDAVNVSGTLAGLDGADTGTTTDAVFRIVIGDSDFSNNFWTATRTWADIFTGSDGTSAKSDWASIFGGGFQYYHTNGSAISSPVGGSFSVSGNSLVWSAVPEPTSALGGLLLAAGLLRRRRA